MPSPPVLRTVTLTEFVNYCDGLLRPLADSARVFGEAKLADLLEAAATEAQRIEQGTPNR